MMDNTHKRNNAIAFINGSYVEQFRIHDGDYITVDGGAPLQVTYLDETHFSIAGNCWHYCQFGQQVIDRGALVEPYANVQP